MARSIFWVSSVLGILFLSTPSTAEYRVVVQEAHSNRYGYFHLTPDGKYACVITGANDHVLQIIAPGGPTVLRRFFLPDHIESASIDSSTGKLAVSTHSAVYLGSLTEERLQEILPGVSGAVLLQEGA